jgi:multidrug resistance efflux pump
MDQEYLTKAVHDEFVQRMEVENERIRDENDRQNHRLDLLEKNAEEAHRLTISVEKMALSTENMANELKRQGERLAAIEQKPGKAWESLKGTIIAAIASGLVGAVLGAVLAGIGGA